MTRISHSTCLTLMLCASLFTLPVLAGGNGQGNGQGNNIQSRVDALETQVTTLTQNVQTLSQQLAATQNEVTALAASDSSQTQTLQTLMQQLASTQAQLTAAQTDLAAAQAQLQTTQTQLNALATTDTTLQAQLTALQTTVAGTQTQLETLNASATGTQNQLTALQAQVDALKATDVSTQNDVTALQTQMAVLQSQLDTYKTTTASLAQLEELQAKMNALQAQINALDPSQYYKRDGSVALTGPLAGGGQDAVNLNNISAAGTVSATKVSAVNISPELVVVAGSSCDPAQQGYFAKDSSGLLFSCQSGAWSRLHEIRQTLRVNTTCASNEKLTSGGYACTGTGYAKWAYPDLTSKTWVVDCYGGITTVYNVCTQD